MAETLARDRLYPSLLDRLIDEDPTKAVEPRDNRAFSTARLRESVLRDMNWLFNCTQSSDDLEAYPEVRKSVLNFGLPAVSGRPASSLRLVDLARALREALIFFEPRLIPHTVRVHVEADKKSSHNVVTFKMEAQLWAQPIPLEIFMRTDMDLESGQTRVVESNER
ncbi:type VI secretion system baseplate subunit TssE [Piscinibacter sakaiensis]|uniref:type VI secretion system baseplate subunit TssE n=1 Tax=Piscinibacter sakaiensis TaxID=1547922 RepID=UPI003AAC2EF8